LPATVFLQKDQVTSAVFLTSANSVRNVPDQPVSISGIPRIGPDSSGQVLDKPLTLSKRRQNSRNSWGFLPRFVWNVEDETPNPSGILRIDLMRFLENLRFFHFPEEKTLVTNSASAMPFPETGN
jgi:hypothetical protein